MSNSKTSKGFANVSIKVCKYIIMAVIIIVCATAAYNFGTKIFYSAGVEAKPGTDMTVTIKKGTTIKSGRLQAKSQAKRRIFNIFLFLISPKICLGEIFSKVHNHGIPAMANLFLFFMF